MDFVSAFTTHFNYVLVVILMMTGFYMVIARPNMIKQLAGLSIFQAAVFVFYISLAYVSGGTAPIITETDRIYANPLPHVLILTAIVVSVATLAVGLALVVRIHEAFGTAEEDDILNRERDGSKPDGDR